MTFVLIVNLSASASIYIDFITVIFTDVDSMLIVIITTSPTISVFAIVKPAFIKVTSPASDLFFAGTYNSVASPISTECHHCVAGCGGKR
jgi:hypothetical protein